jgi:GNAT superfamily N-acetyltransferase
LGEITSPRPLAESDDRTRFDCGREPLNHWFRRHGWANHAEGISRTNVICDAATAEIIGYVTLSAAQIERGFLPKAQQRNKPDPVPATLLGQLAVHKDHQGKGYARSLLIFALRTALRASRDVGSFGVITHPIDDQVRAFYAKFDFEDLPFDPRRGMIVRMIDLEKSRIGG